MNTEIEDKNQSDDTDEIEQLRLFLEQHPEDVTVARKLAQQCSDRGWLNESISIYQHLVTQNSADYDVLLAYGNILYIKNRYKEAVEIFSQCTELKQNRVEGWNNLGIIYMVTDNYEDAKVCFEKVIELEPDNYGALLNLGNYYDHIQNDSEAIAFFKKALGFKSDFTDAWYDLGNTYLKKRDYVQAIESFQQALKFDRMFYSAIKNCGFAFEMRTEYEQALECYVQAKEINCTDPSLYINIAQVYLKISELDKAKQNFMSAIKLGPQNIGGWIGLRQVHLKKGDILGFFKTTYAVSKYLSNEELLQTIILLRQMKKKKYCSLLLKQCIEQGRLDIELDAELMVYYCMSEENKPLAAQMYQKLKVFESPSDHVLHCCAYYASTMKKYDEVLVHINHMQDKNQQDYRLLWTALIEKKEYVFAEQLIIHYKENHKDFVDTGYFLALLCARKNKREEAKYHLQQALEAGFSELGLIKADKDLKQLYEILHQENTQSVMHESDTVSG